MARLSHATPDILSLVLGSLPLRERLNCALVCKAWAEAAVAATHSIILKHRMQDFCGLQHWLVKHGDRLEVLQLHAGYNTALTALPCCAKLQDLLLHGCGQCISIPSRTWGDIASATKLTAISLRFVQTTSQQADVIAALTALPNLEQLTWRVVRCSNQQRLSDSSLLQQMTQLTSLDLQSVTPAALQYLGSLTKLQHLSINDDDDVQLAGMDHWAAAGCPVLQKLKSLTSLVLSSWNLDDLPASVSQLTALQQLDVCEATPTALNQLQVLTDLTQLCVREVTGLSLESPPLQLPGLQYLELFDNDMESTMPMSFLARCTQLQFLKLLGYDFKGPGSLIASTTLQHLELLACTITAADGAADPASWQQVFPGPGQLPHLTSLRLFAEEPALQQADIDRVVACCCSLKVLGRDTLQSSLTPTLARLPGLTNLQLLDANDEECSAVVQLTGLKQLEVNVTCQMSAVGLRQLAGLNQLTSLGLGSFTCHELNILAEYLIKGSLPDCLYAIINQVCGQVGWLGVGVKRVCYVMAECCRAFQWSPGVDSGHRHLQLQAARLHMNGTEPQTCDRVSSKASPDSLV